MEEEEEGKSNFFEEPGICNSTTKNTLTYQVENILFKKRQARSSSRGSQIRQTWRILSQNV